MRLPEEEVLRKEKEKALTKGEARAVRSEGGNLERFVNRVKTWNIKWESAQLDFTVDQSQVGGRMQGVSGEFWQAGERASTFVANEGVTERGSQVLRIQGGVKVTGASGSYIRCDVLTYDGTTGIMEASGNIVAVQEGYKITGVTKVLADGHLKQFATPDLFDRSAIGPPLKIEDLIKGKK
jgi:hypothetical protein